MSNKAPEACQGQGALTADYSMQGITSESAARKELWFVIF